MTALPANQEALALSLADPTWRLNNLYYILVKVAVEPGDDTAEDKIPTKRVLFRPNDAQVRLLSNLWFRNVVLKARQVGITTAVCIAWLDHALFVADQRCGIVAQDDGAAKIIFRDKVKYAYDQLPLVLRRRFPLERDSADELLFRHNNSSVRVATSMRSGTLDRLHISEMGKISALYPQKAVEVMTGSIPAVSDTGIVIMESTAEGREGEFYEVVQGAQKLVTERRRLTVKDYRMHFTAWWQHPDYQMDPAGVRITDEEHTYFDGIEQECVCKIDLGQRAWYVKTRETTFNGSEAKMWQEYPSTPEEAFQVSGDGYYYAKDMVALRKRGGIRELPILDVPVNTFWDIGRSDGCGIWLHQEMKGDHRFIGYIEAHNHTLAHYVGELKDFQKAHGPFVWGKHFLPHDANHRKLSDTNRTTEEMLNDLGVVNTVIVPVITQLINGIDQTRKHLKNAYFDDQRTIDGVKRIDGYCKVYSTKDQCYTDEPNKRNGCSEGADALRQWGQAIEGGLLEAGFDGVYEPPEPTDWRL